jgi:NADH:ubiquinone oxidoreductase subunit B-like Fe-S oxidoreductase
LGTDAPRLDRGGSVMGIIENRFQKNVLTSSLDFIFNWSRRSSLCPLDRPIS